MDSDNSEAPRTTIMESWPSIPHKTASSTTTPNGDLKQEQKASSASFPSVALPSNNIKKTSKCVAIKVDDDEENRKQNSEDDEHDDDVEPLKKCASGLQLRLNVGGRSAQLSMTKVWNFRNGHFGMLTF